MLSVHDLCTQYLSNVSFDVAPRTMTALLGPTGSGKTTLLRHLTRQKPSRAVEWVERPGAIRWIPSKLPNEMLRLTLREALLLHGAASAADAAAWARQFGMDRNLDVRGDSGLLSTGQLRVFGLALGLFDVPQEAAVFIDELTNGLSIVIITKLMKVLRRLMAEKQILLVCCVHQPSVDVLAQFDRVLVLCKGRLILQKPTTELIPTNSDPVAVERELIDMLDRVDPAEAEPAPESTLATVSEGVSALRRTKLPVSATFKLHWKLKTRSPAFLLSAFIGALLVVLLNLLVNANNHYVSLLIPNKPMNPPPAAAGIVDGMAAGGAGGGADGGADGWADGWAAALPNMRRLEALPRVVSPPGVIANFSLFDGDIERSAETAAFVSRLSQEFVSTVLFGMDSYDRKTGRLEQSAITQPILEYLSSLDRSKMAVIGEYILSVRPTVDCLYDKWRKERPEVASLYHEYTPVFDPNSLDPVIEAHRLMLALDYLTVDQAPLWRSIQLECFDHASATGLYTCAAAKLTDIIDSVTDCLDWPRVPLLGGVRSIFAGFVSWPKKPSRRELSENKISRSAWYDLHGALTFAGESVLDVVSKLLTPSIGAEQVRKYYWLARIGGALEELQDNALAHCRYTVCQLPLLVWPWLISIVRDLLRLIWVDVSNVALIFVLTAVVGCSGLESALSFNELREICTYYNDRSRHYWARSLVELAVFAIPTFAMGAIVTASLRIRMTPSALLRSTLVNGAIGMLGCFSANSFATAMAACFKGRLQSLVASAVVLSLFLLVSGFILKRQRSNSAVNILSYLSMFRFTYKAMIMNLYEHANGRVGVLSDAFTLAFVAGVHREEELSVAACCCVLLAQTVGYRLLGAAIFRWTHTTHELASE